MEYSFENTREICIQTFKEICIVTFYYAGKTCRIQIGKCLSENGKQVYEMVLFLLILRWWDYLWGSTEFPCCKGGLKQCLHSSTYDTMPFLYTPV